MWPSSLAAPACLLLATTLLESSWAAPLYRIPSVNCYPDSEAAIARGHGELTLTVAPGRWNVDGQVAFNTRAYHYNGVQTIPGPTIHLKAGTQCQLTLVNALSTAGQAQCDAEMASWVPGTMSFFHCPDVTNMHTHGEAEGRGRKPRNPWAVSDDCKRLLSTEMFLPGLHISGAQDDVISPVIPGTQKLYTYDILPNHQAGTHW